MGGGKDTLVGRDDVIPDGDGPIYVSPGATDIQPLNVAIDPWRLLRLSL